MGLCRVYRSILFFHLQNPVFNLTLTWLQKVLNKVRQGLAFMKLTENKEIIADSNKSSCCTDSAISSQWVFQVVALAFWGLCGFKGQGKGKQASDLRNSVPVVYGGAFQGPEYSPGKQGQMFPSPGSGCCALEVPGLPRIPSGSHNSR